MGCGSSSSSLPPESPGPTSTTTTAGSKLHEDGLQEAWAVKTGREDTWATKTEPTKPLGGYTSEEVTRHAVQDMDILIVSEEGEEATTEVASSNAGSASFAGLVPAPAAANAARPATARSIQNGLESVSEERQSLQPLPRQQREEAAKLAETRRRFNNQRYQQADPNAPPGQGGARTNNNGVVGFSLNSGGTALDTDTNLPGGVFDEHEPQFVPTKVDRQRSRGSKGFNADEEQLMEDIMGELEIGTL